MDFFYLRFLWKVIRGRSLTFALIMAMGFIGFSLAGALRSVFQMLGFAWPLAWIAGGIAIAMLAKYEHKFPLSDKFRFKLSIAVIICSLAASFMLNSYENKLTKDIPIYNLDTVQD